MPSLSKADRAFLSRDYTKGPSSLQGAPTEVSESLMQAAGKCIPRRANYCTYHNELAEEVLKTPATVSLSPVQETEQLSA